MNVMSKLLYSMFPRSFAGFALVALPLAAVALVLVSPQTIVKLLVREDPEKLLEELTEGDREEDKRPFSKKNSSAKGSKKASKKAAKPQKTATSSAASSATSSASGSCEEEEGRFEGDTESLDSFDDAQLLHLAAIQKTTKKKTSSKSPTLADIKVAGGDGKDDLSQIDGKKPSAAPQEPPLAMEGEENGWSRVPTKQEETIAGLRSRISTLTTSLQDANEERSLLKAAVEKQSMLNAQLDQQLSSHQHALNRQMSALETENKQLKTQQEALQKRLGQDLEKQCNGHTQVIEEKTESIKRFEQAVADNEGTIARLTVELAQSKSHLAIESEKARLTLQQLEANKSESTENKRQLERELESLQESVRKESESKEKISVQLHEKCRENADTLDTNTKLEKANSDLTQQVAMLSQKLALEGEKVASSQKQIKDLQNMAESANKDSQLYEDSFQERLKALQDKLTSATDAISKKDDEIVSVKSASEKVVAELSQDYSTLSKKFEASQEANQQLSKQVSNLEATIVELRAAMEKGDKRFEILKTVSEKKYAKYEEELALSRSLSSPPTASKTVENDAK